MPLDPDLAAFLELVAAGVANGVNPLHEWSSAETVARPRRLQRGLDLPAMAWRSVRPIRIPVRDEKTKSTQGFMRGMFLRASSLCPPCCSPRRWVLRWEPSIPMTLYEGHLVLNAVPALSIAYRSKPEHPFPSAVHDSQTHTSGCLPPVGDRYENVFAVGVRVPAGPWRRS